MLDDAADEQALERIRQICAALAPCDEDVLQGRPLFHVARRRFAIFNGVSSPARARWSGAGRSLHFLSEPAERDALRHDDRFAPSPHHGDRGWFALRLDDRADWDEIAELLAAAHAQVWRHR